MSTKVAVVIPVYHEELSDLEKISLAQCRKILGNYPLIFVAPDGKDFSYFKAGDSVANFPAEYFRSKETYTRLLTSPFFYETFSDFEYMLIYQLDAFVFYDALKEFCSLGYDYVGAPWPRMYSWQIAGKNIRVGNGGFSLRKVAACHKLLFRQPDLLKRYRELPEDAFFAYCGTKPELNFNVAPINVAQLFSMEFLPARSVKKNGGALPFGCHDWFGKYSDFYSKLFLSFGWDLRPLQHLMSDSDGGFGVWILELAILRLLRRIEHGQSILRYLPTKNFASVRVLRSAIAMKILARLLTEENFRVDKIFICGEDERTNLFRDVTRENLPHLIIAADYDTSLSADAEKRGLRYGEHFVSFSQEYLQCCEKLLRGFGQSFVDR